MSIANKLFIILILVIDIILITATAVVVVDNSSAKVITEQNNGSNTMHLVGNEEVTLSYNPETGNINCQGTAYSWIPTFLGFMITTDSGGYYQYDSTNALFYLDDSSNFCLANVSGVITFVIDGVNKNVSCTDDNGTYSWNYKEFAFYPANSGKYSIFSLKNGNPIYYNDLSQIYSWSYDNGCAAGINGSNIVNSNLANITITYNEIQMHTDLYRLSGTYTGTQIISEDGSTTHIATEFIVPASVEYEQKVAVGTLYIGYVIIAILSISFVLYLNIAIREMRK